MNKTLTLFIIGFSLALSLSSGCGKKAVKPPTIVNVEFQTAENLNPDDSGRPSPVSVRLYGLTSLGQFNAVDFFTLYDDERKALGNSLRMREELHLKPGSKKIYTHELPEGTLYLGVVAAFRSMETAVWRDSIPVPANRSTNFSIKLGANSVSIQVE